MFMRTLLSLWLVAVVSSARLAPQDPAPAPGGVLYTEAQAARGETLFKEICVECHARKELSNPDFRVKWNGRSVFDLFDRLRNSMPERNPGGLERSQYLDVTAFIAKLNGFAPGTAEMADDEPALRKQMLVLK
jgi:mono/diheme cytochrome c family protein